ncbi:hypothetical protein [Devosia sp. DBB001]|nr:hypothetical protein [Devosia sp. DBB001]
MNEHAEAFVREPGLAVRGTAAGYESLIQSILLYQLSNRFD